MLKGKIKWFNEKKEYGFIENDEKGDVFVHVSQISAFCNRESGESVIFDIAERKGRIQAVNVRPEKLIFKPSSASLPVSQTMKKSEEKSYDVEKVMRILSE